MVTTTPPRVFGEDLCGPGSLSLVLNALGDSATPAELDATLPKAPRGGVLSVDLLIAARQRGFEAWLGPGDSTTLASEVGAGRAAILMLRLLDAPGTQRDIYHYVVVDGIDADRALFRFQFGDGKVRWARLGEIDKSWKATGRALLRVRRPGGGSEELARAVTLEKAGRRAEARDAYRRVVEANPTSVRAFTNLGNVEAALGNPREAETAYRKAATIAPGDRDALNNLAWLLLEEGTRLEEAETLAANAAAQPGPERPLAQDTLGRVQLARGRCEDALRTFGEALAASPPGEAGRGGLLEGQNWTPAPGIESRIAPSLCPLPQPYSQPACQ